MSPTASTGRRIIVHAEDDPACMMGALARLRKPEKQTAYDSALQRGAKLGIKEMVIPRERMELAKE